MKPERTQGDSEGCNSECWVGHSLVRYSGEGQLATLLQVDGMDMAIWDGLEGGILLDRQRLR